VRHTHREKEWSGRSRERNTVGRVAVGGVWWVRVSYDCEHQKTNFSLSPVCTRDCPCIHEEDEVEETFLFGRGGFSYR
jgi:hypothetical protein